MSISTRAALVLVALCATISPAAAQGPPLALPQPSPAAIVTQQVGLTDVTISYHRPAVNKREVWGKLVPYDQVWRAGANENTTIEVSTPFTIGGKQLPAGTYGLQCALIVGVRSASTDLKTSLNDVLREFEIAV